MKKILTFLILFFLFTCFLSSCEKGGATYSDGYFKYKIDSETGKARIFAFTKEGEKQETIVFPTMIGGREVLTLGYEIKSFVSTSYFIKHEFKSDNLKTIYFPSIYAKVKIDPENGMYENIINITNIFWGSDYYCGSLYDFSCNFYLSTKNYNVNECYGYNVAENEHYSLHSEKDGEGISLKKNYMIVL